MSSPQADHFVNLNAAVYDYGNAEHPGECCRARVEYRREDGTLVEVVDVPMESPTTEMVSPDHEAVEAAFPSLQLEVRGHSR